MALDMELLQGLGVPDEHIETILSGHLDTVNGLKESIATHKQEAEKYNELVAERDRLLAERESMPDYKAAYESLTAEFEAFKASDRKQTLYRELAEEVGVPFRHIEAVCRKHITDKLDLDKDGNLKNREHLARELELEWDIDTTGRRKMQQDSTRSAALDKIRGVK